MAHVWTCSRRGREGEYGRVWESKRNERVETEGVKRNENKGQAEVLSMRDPAVVHKEKEGVARRGRWDCARWVLNAAPGLHSLAPRRQRAIRFSLFFHG